MQQPVGEPLVQPFGEPDHRAQHEPVHKSVGQSKHVPVAFSHGDADAFPVDVAFRESFSPNGHALQVADRALRA